MAIPSEARGVWTWSAVIAGVVGSLITQVLLTMLGLGVGLLAIDLPTASSAPATISTAALLWWIASGVFSAFVGGAIAGAYAPFDAVNARLAHALSAWAIASLIVVGAAAVSAGAGSIVTNLAGPGVSTIARIQPANRPVVTNTPAPTQAQIEQARKAAAVSMLASFIGLLCGALAAAMGGWWSTEVRDELGAKTARAR
jgi:hypothetical protein